MDFKVTPEYVANAAANCDATANEIQAQLAALKSYVVNLEATYHGVAATTFQALMQDYDTFGQMLNNALTDIGSGLRGNYVNYTDTEQQNISNLVPIQGDLPGARL
ncbi:WXG100 family type VII secretion target [Dactylosporangium sp. CA-139066]|uniref:WXG100 family type VII secretion target n=1 Tax=Dactylosporangium sp. CA-139066 TaxID=3239930 RepID=UPI003D8D6743